jgi:hypothetical protein
MKYVNLFLGSIMLLSCGSDNSTDASQPTTTIDTISTADNPVDLKELDKKFPSSYLTKEMIQTAFEQPEIENLEFSDDGKCYYNWNKDNFNYAVSFQFYFPGELDEIKSEEMYTTLINKYTLEKDMPIELPNVGDKAIWSQLGGGQLIAKKGNDILILNMDIINLDGFVQLGIADEATRAKMIKMGTDLMTQIINKL